MRFTQNEGLTRPCRIRYTERLNIRFIYFQILEIILFVALVYLSYLILSVSLLLFFVFLSSLLFKFFYNSLIARANGTAKYFRSVYIGVFGNNIGVELAKSRDECVGFEISFAARVKNKP